MAVDRSRLAAALAYRQAEEERRRRMMESVPVPGAELPTPAPSQNLRRDLENLSIGIGEGLTNQLEGVKGIVTDPIGAARGAYEGVKAVVRDPSIIADALRYTAQKVGSGPLGAGEVIGEMIGPRKTGPTIAELDVYHGTPHRFPATEANPLGEFDASKIGTGEGAQAYGHGVYLAENPEIASGYRKDLSNYTQPFVQFKGQKIAGTSLSDLDIAAYKYLQQGQKNAGQFPHNTVYYAKKAVENAPDKYWSEKFSKEEILNRINEYGSDVKFGEEKNLGTLYKADLPDEMIDRMLDWDKPLSEQSPFVQQALQKSWGIDEPYVTKSGERLWNELSRPALAGTPTESGKSAAEFLRQAGIPGIKYLDAGSRGRGGSGTRNFVVFPGEEKKVRILERK